MIENINQNNLIYICSQSEFKMAYSTLRTSFYPNRPPARLAKQSRHLMVEEKFETALDLRNLCRNLTVAQALRDWSTASVKNSTLEWSPDTCYELYKLDMRPPALQLAIVTPTMPSLLIKHVLTTPITRCYMNNKSVRDLLDSIKTSTWQAFKVQHGHMTSNVMPDAKRLTQYDETIWQQKIYEWPPEVSRFMYVVLDMRYLINAFRSIHSHTKGKSVRQRVENRFKLGARYRVDLPSLGAEAFLTHDICILDWKSERYILDNKLMLECYNKIVETHAALLFNHYQSGTCLPDSQYDLTCDFIRHLSCRVSSFSRPGCESSKFAYENKGFKYLKMIEGIGVSEIIHRNDLYDGWNNVLLKETLWSVVTAENLDWNRRFEDSELGKILSQATTPQIAEILGLVKLCGHPTIEIEQGLQKLYERTHNQLHISQARVNRSVGVLMRDLFKNYYVCHKRFPVIVSRIQTLHEGLQELLGQNINPASPRGVLLMRRIPLLAWAQVELGKNAEFDPVINVIPLLKDKALGITRSKVFQMVILPTTIEDEYRETPLQGQDAARLRSNRLGPIVDRRAILNFLLSPHYDKSFTEYINRYEQEDPWSQAVEDYLVIKLTAKELEHKPEGRYFGASPMEERNRRIVQEFNAMKFMDAYTPDQLMTPNELMMIKKLYSFRHLGRLYPNSTTFQVSFDFSKWNNNMRSRSVDVPAARLLDPWYGRNLYGKTMKAYEHALIYYSDPVGQQYWVGQQGGIEGLNQATWSYIFLGGIKQALEEIGVVYQVTVKGDDVRAALVINNHEIRRRGVEHVRDTILQRLAALCADMGWELNPQECFVSLTTICTSKQYQVRDTWLPAASKKVMKVESLANLVFPTLEDIVSSIFSTSHSACSQATVVYPAFITALTVASRTLIIEFWESHINVNELTVLLLWPQVLSGPGSLPLQTFFVRGENDLLSISFSLFRYILMDSEYYTLYPYIINVLSQKFESEPDFGLLLGDPYAIPVDAPERPMSVLKRIMREALSAWAQNPDIQMLLSYQAERDAQNFRYVLLSMTPFYPKLATALWEVSPFYLITEIMSKFIQSSTVIAFLSRTIHGKQDLNIAHRALHALIRAAERRKTYWMSRLRNPCGSSPLLLGLADSDVLDENVCTTALVHEIRHRAWGRRLKGITYPSLVDQNILLSGSDFITYLPGVNLEGFSSTITYNSNLVQYQCEERSHHYAAIPGVVPWLGARTGSKVKLKDLSLDIESPTLKKIRSLIGLRRAGNYFGRTFTDIVDQLLAALTDIRVGPLLNVTPEAGGGHLAHRIQINSFSMSTMPNSRPNLYQLVSMQDELLRAIQQDPEDRTINFAARHYFTISLALLRLQSHLHLSVSHPTNLRVLFHGCLTDNKRYELCPHCCNIVTDEQVEFQTIHMPHLYQYRSIPLVGASETENRLLEASLISLIHGQARRLLDERHLDTENPAYLNAATQLIIHTLGEDMKNVFEQAQAANFERIPTGNLLDIMASTLGLRNVSSTRISLNALRAMSPRALYLAVLGESFRWVFDWFLDQRGEDDTEAIISLLPHRNPLATFFSLLITSGVMHKVMRGCRDEQLVSGRFQWSHAALTHGHSASTEFIRYHVNMFRNWIDYGDVLDECKYMINMADNDTLLRTMHREYGRFLNYGIRSLLRPVGDASPLTHILGLIMRSMYRRPKESEKRQNYPFMYDMADRVVGVTYYGFWPDAERLMIPLPDLVKGIIDLIHAHRVHNPPITAIPESIFRIVFAMNFPDYVEPADWDELLAEENYLPYFHYKVARLKQDADDRDAGLRLHGWEDVAVENHAGRKYLSDRVGEFRARIIWELCDRLVSVLTWTDVEWGIYDNLWDVHIRTISWFNSRVLCVMTLEDAERLLKQQGIDLYSLNEPAVVDIDEEAFQVGLDDHDHGEDDLGLDRLFNEALQMRARYEGCTYPHRHVMNDQGMEVPEMIRVGPEIIAWLDDLRIVLIPSDVANSHQQPYVGYEEVGRCFGGINASVGRWIEVLLYTGVISTGQDYNSCQTIIAIGDGGGGITKILLDNFKEDHVVFCSLFISPHDQTPVAGAPISNPPPEIIAERDLHTYMSRIHYTEAYPGDIRDAIVRETIVRQVKMLGAPVRLLFCDVDQPKGMETIEYVNLLYDVCTLVAIDDFIAQTVILKVKIDRSLRLAELLYFLSTRWHHTHVVRPRFSRSHHNEVFLILRELIRYREFPEELARIQSAQWTVALHHNLHHSLIEQLEITQHQYGRGITQSISLLPTLPRFYERCAENAIPVMSLGNLLGPTMDVAVTTSRCVCRVPNGILAQLRVMLDANEGQCRKMIDKRGHNAPQNPFQTRMGQPLTSVKIFTKTHMSRMVQLTTLTVFFEELDKRGFSGRPNWFNVIYHAILGRIFDFISLLRLNVHLVLYHGQYYIIGKECNLSVTTIVRKTFRYCVRLLGSLMYVSVMIYSRDDLRVLERELQQRWGVANINPCCRERAGHEVTCMNTWRGYLENPVLVTVRPGDTNIYRCHPAEHPAFDAGVRPIFPHGPFECVPSTQLRGMWMTRRIQMVTRRLDMRTLPDSAFVIEAARDDSLPEMEDDDYL